MLRRWTMKSPMMNLTTSRTMNLSTERSLTMNRTMRTRSRNHFSFRVNSLIVPQVPVVVARDESNVLVVASELSESCLLSLSYPGFILDNTKREDIVFIAFQVWVLGMSLVAIINESIPQIIASCATHLMATAWSAFQITHTARFRANFHRAVINGACAGTSLIPDYWVQRESLEYATLALNIVALFVSIFLSWKMLKTFKRLGASLTIHRIYELILAFSIILQLSLFFMLVTVSLWIESLFNGVASEVAQFPTLYKAAAFITVFLLIPWLSSGWFAVRKENRRLMFMFLFLALLYLTGWAVMFYSDSFRWTFLNWLFYSIMASLSVALTVTAFMLGVICRYNFGKGLPHFLNPDESVSDTDSTHSFDEEKVAFPSREMVRPFSMVFEIVHPPVAAAPPIPEMPRDIPAEPTVAPPTFMGSGRTAESGSHQDLPLARPGFRELILRSDTTSTVMSRSTTRS
ncbi:hypothetical protein BDZ89DRAFT_647470 [Hymenopellis radicata]|nr:hypothetical protein BDZ89DRAFT_647470 [Hymenopellis radicata]